ncbi:MAG TPA: transcriptional regulator [Sphingomicrobium sp.]|nr:transcriptional regulator [Sphingomicrobium sp.]
MSCYRFGPFQLDPDDRQLRRDGAPVELNARYLDALSLMVREQGRLVSKDRFLDEVWRGVPVTDEALTQCIRTLRRQLGDDAASPRFIETVPKHGYRFLAPVEEIGVTPGPRAKADHRWQQFFRIAGAGTIGAGVAGFAGGLAYGVAGASQPLQPGMGGVSVLLVLLWLTIAAALMGGAGVSVGIAAADLTRESRWRIAGGAVGGMLVGGFAKLLGLDAFNLLLGRSPGQITGATEGLMLGGAVGLGSWLAAGRGWSVRRSVAAAGLVGGAAGLLIALLGGRLMGGSLDLLAETFPDSRLRIDPIGALFGESGFGEVSQVATAVIEGALFAACIVGAMMLVRRTSA